MNRLLSISLICCSIAVSHAQTVQDLCEGNHTFIPRENNTCFNNTVTITSDYAIIAWREFNVRDTLTYTSNAPSVNIVEARQTVISGNIISNGPFALIQFNRGGIDILGSIRAPEVLVSANTYRGFSLSAVENFLKKEDDLLLIANSTSSRLKINGGTIQATNGSVRLVARDIDIEGPSLITASGDVSLAGASNVLVGQTGLTVSGSSAGGDIRIGSNAEIQGANVNLLAHNPEVQSLPPRKIVNHGTIRATSPEGRVFVRISGAGGGAFLHSGEETGVGEAVIYGNLELDQMTVLTGTGLINPAESDPPPILFASARQVSLMDRSATRSNPVKESAPMPTLPAIQAPSSIRQSTSRDSSDYKVSQSQNPKEEKQKLQKTVSAKTKKKARKKIASSLVTIVKTQ